FVIPAGADTAGVAVRLVRNTLCAGAALALHDEAGKAPAGPTPAGRIGLEASDNVFDTAGRLLGAGKIVAGPPLPDFKAGQALLRERLAWRERGNLYGVTAPYLRLLHGTKLPGEERTGLNSLAEWQALWEVKETSSREDRPVYRSALLNARDLSRC